MKKSCITLFLFKQDLPEFLHKSKNAQIADIIRLFGHLIIF